MPLTPFFFDLLHLDGRDLIDAPGRRAARALAGLLPAEFRVPRLVTGDAAAAEAFFADAVARGHEGVVVKSLDAPYAAGRRGGDWIKVKPAAHPGPGGARRRVGSRAAPRLAVQPAPGGPRPATGGLVMLGKTFKGLTDEMLALADRELLDLAEPRRRHPEAT